LNVGVEGTQIDVRVAGIVLEMPDQDDEGDGPDLSTRREDQIEQSFEQLIDKHKSLGSEALQLLHGTQHDVLSVRLLYDLDQVEKVW